MVISTIFVAMRFRISLLFLAIAFGSFGQKFRFNSSIGASHFSWHENQTTLDLAAEISFQNPNKNHRTFFAFKTMLVEVVYDEFIPDTVQGESHSALCIVAS